MIQITGNIRHLLMHPDVEQIVRWTVESNKSYSTRDLHFDMLVLTVVCHVVPPFLFGCEFITQVNTRTYFAIDPQQNRIVDNGTRPCQSLPMHYDPLRRDSMNALSLPIFEHLIDPIL